MQSSSCIYVYGEHTHTMQFICVIHITWPKNSQNTLDTLEPWLNPFFYCAVTDTRTYRNHIDKSVQSVPPLQVRRTLRAHEIQVATEPQQSHSTPTIATKDMQKDTVHASCCPAACTLAAQRNILLINWYTKFHLHLRKIMIMRAHSGEMTTSCMLDIFNCVVVITINTAAVLWLFCRN